ncbi:hypothetical protein DPSP01_013084 [Paraphaeosphaeria sporulosa]|uniref:Thymidylate kinase n=1 Tax=Paraphaeosphaeria sporulosa TaxID=1460663 RepID=A0A177CB00_9PLEO|nr:uncharacterized protein CC84DRAFT_1147576 [Paraphaeosphaeria sporulosa]OAG04745.1 hypothetical protein CC84DRAFT_1147576 [Paraphaeosphaeria sporulosa]
MALFTRQPFAELGAPRLQALQSAKNRQNALTPASNSKFASPLKPSPTASTGKRSRGPAIFEDDDSENADPSIFNSPTKKSKTSDGFSKPSKFALVPSPLRTREPLTASPSIPSVRKALSSPNTTTSTPISHSRGSPKHKRIGALSKRRASSSPFRRVDPPSFSAHSSPALPFSIDAALSGTIPNYTPKPVATPTPAAVPVSAPLELASHVEDSMPTSWFFEIHEDTPEQEAANLMEHSASVLDISSDDDAATKARNEELERGKENIPPPDFTLSQAQSRGASSVSLESAGVEAAGVKMPRLREVKQDAMDEDRKPLGDLPASEFYGEGCDKDSYVVVDKGIERPSGLSKEFEFSCATEEEPQPVPEEAPIEAAKEEESVVVYADENVVPVAQEDILEATLAVTSESQPLADEAP